MVRDGKVEDAFAVMECCFVIAVSKSTVVCGSPLSMQSFRLVYITSRWAYSNRNKDISESSFKPCYLDAVISIDCQLDRI